MTLCANFDASAQICRPISERTVEVGCWITAHAMLAELPRAPVFWHLDTYPTLAEAEVAKGQRGTVLEALWKGLAAHDRGGGMASPGR